MKTNKLVHKLELRGNIKGVRYCAYNSTKIRKTYFSALLDVMKPNKFNLFQFLANFFLIVILAIIFALLLVLAFHLPELGEKINNLY